MLSGYTAVSATLAVLLIGCITVQIRWTRGGKMKFVAFNASSVVSPSEHCSGGCLLVLRCVFAAVVLTCATTLSWPGSRAISLNIDGAELPFAGPQFLLTLSGLSWLLEGLYFLAAAVVSVNHVVGAKQPSHVVSCALWVWFELMLAMALMVTLVVWLVLFPLVAYIEHRVAILILSHPLVLLVHNANTVFIFAEYALNSLYVEPRHFVFAVYFGLAFVMTQWHLAAKYGIWIYFFLNYDLPFSVLWYIGLAGSIILFYYGSALLACRWKGKPPLKLA